VSTLKPAGSRDKTGRAHALVEAAASTARKRVDTLTIVGNGYEVGGYEGG